MHLWIISAFDPTPIDRTRPMRFMGIADAALAAGHRVTYFSNTFRHSTRELRFSRGTSVDVAENYKLIFLESTPYRNSISIARLRSYARFGLSLEKKANTMSKPDIIFVSIPPLSSADRISFWAKRKNIPIVVDIIDPWPDAFINRVHGLKVLLWRLLVLPLSLKLNGILGRISGVTAISQAYVDWALKRAGREIPSACFYPAVPFRDVTRQLAELGTGQSTRNGELHLVYAGSLGSSYDIPSILKAAEKLEQSYSGRTRFSIAGSGSQEGLVRKAAAESPNVEYLGRLDRDALLELFSRAHVGLMQHMPGATQTVTYKLFDYLGAGLPVINSLQSEVVEIIQKNRVGFNHEPGDADGLVRSVEKFLTEPGLLGEYRERALDLTSRKGDSETVYGALIKFLEQIQTSGGHVVQKGIKKDP